MRRVVITLLTVLLASACAAPPDPAATMRAAEGPAQAEQLTMYRSPACSCCHRWAEIARESGWSVSSVDEVDMAAFKAEAGVPSEYASCHTTIVAGYFVEGHVPLAAVERLLSERPAIDGIALPGMPAGSPGMGGLALDDLEVFAITDGVAAPFGSY